MKVPALRRRPPRRARPGATGGPWEVPEDPNYVERSRWTRVVVVYGEGYGGLGFETPKYLLLARSGRDWASPGGRRGPCGRSRPRRRRSRRGSSSRAVRTSAPTDLSGSRRQIGGWTAPLGQKLRDVPRVRRHTRMIVYRALVESFFASVAGKSSRALRKSRARARRVDRALERREAPLQWPRRPRVAVFQHAAARLLVGLAVPTAEPTPELGAFGCARRLRYVVLARDHHSRRRARRAVVRISIDAPWRRPGCRFMPPGRRSDVGSMWRKQRRSSLAPRARGSSSHTSRGSRAPFAPLRPLDDASRRASSPLLWQLVPPRRVEFARNYVGVCWISLVVNLDHLSSPSQIKLLVVVVLSQLAASPGWRGL